MLGRVCNLSLLYTSLGVACALAHGGCTGRGCSCLFFYLSPRVRIALGAGSNQLLGKLVLNWLPSLTCHFKFVPPTEHAQVKLFGAEVVKKIGVAKTSNTDKTFKDANPAIVS